MTDTTEIDWLDGQGFVELSDREKMLMDQAREAGYQRGYRDGEQHGTAEVLRAATELTTALENRPVKRAVAVLERLLGLDREVERPSVYWHTEEPDDL